MPQEPSISPAQADTSRSAAATGNVEPNPPSDAISAGLRHRLSRSVIIAIAITVGVLAVVCVPRLPAGVCFGDAGDLQLASATAGIMHPPGYGGFALVGYLLTRLPGVDPAYLVSLGCLAAGVTALLLAMLLQVRLGGSPWIAGAIAMTLTAHPRVWRNLLAPEVYAPALALEMGAVYLMVRYARGGGRGHLFAAAALLGFAVANRPPVLLAVPFFLAAWWVAKPQGARRHRSVRALLSVMICGATPIIVTLGYLLVRDRPDAAYNYLDVYNAEAADLPETAEGLVARGRRVAWLVSARQFHRNIGPSWRQFRSQLRFARYDVFGHQPLTVMLSAVVLIAVGAWITLRECRAALLVLLGMGVGGLAFVCIYRIQGQAADLLPVLLAAVTFGGMAVSRIISRLRNRTRTALGVTLMSAAAAFTIFDAGGRHHVGAEADAGGFLHELDMATLPADSVICTSWHHGPPLRYARNVDTHRTDIRIVSAVSQNWPRLVGPVDQSPVFVVSPSGHWKGHTFVPYRNVWRVAALD